MYRLLLVLVPAVLLAGHSRYARLGEMDGKVEVQLQAADPWQPAERNLTLTEAALLRTAVASRLEIELDEGSALRLGPDSKREHRHDGEEDLGLHQPSREQDSIPGRVHLVVTWMRYPWGPRKTSP